MSDTIYNATDTTQADNLKSKPLFEIDKPVYKPLPKINTPFIDWLSVTYDADDLPYIISELEQYLPLIGAKSKDRDASIVKWRFPDKKGELKIFQYTNKLEFSGKFLHELRNIFSDIGAGSELLPAYENVIALLSEKDSYRITRCDFSMDVHRSFNAIRTKLVTKCNKTLDGLSFIDGIQFNDKDDQYYKGRWYKSIYSIGTSKQRVSGVVYDKQLEQLQKEGNEIDTRSRYEIRVNYSDDNDKFNVSLQDCLTPSALFYHYSDVMKLSKPANVSEWVSTYNNKRIKRPMNQSSIYAEDRLDTIVSNTTADLFTIVDNDTRYSRVEAIQKIVEEYNDTRTANEPELTLTKCPVLPTVNNSNNSLQSNDTNGLSLFRGGSILSGQTAPKTHRKLNFDEVITEQDDLLKLLNLPEVA